MATLYVFESEQAPLDVYDRINSQIQQPPEGLLCHIASVKDGGGLIVFEVWQSEEQQDRWDAQIQQRISAAGGPPRPAPRKYRVHNMRFGDTQTAGAR
jgi:hypothetical protein